MRLILLTLRATPRWPTSAMHGAQTPPLQTRVKTLNGELGAVFQHWYPDLQLGVEPQAV